MVTVRVIRPGRSLHGTGCVV